MDLLGILRKRGADGDVLLGAVPGSLLYSRPRSSRIVIPPASSVARRPSLSRGGCRYRLQAIDFDDCRSPEAHTRVPRRTLYHYLLSKETICNEI